MKPTRISTSIYVTSAALALYLYPRLSDASVGFTDPASPLGADFGAEISRIDELLRHAHRTLKKVTEDHDDYRWNTMIAALNNLSTAQVRDLVIEDQGGGVSLGCALAVILGVVAGDVATTGGTPRS